MVYYRIGVDEWLRVPSVEDVFALGDCAGFLEQVGKPVLPALAQVRWISFHTRLFSHSFAAAFLISFFDLYIDQVAEREGKFLVELFNRIGKQDGGKASSVKDIPLGDPFVYKHLGSMASVGRYKALVDLRQSKVVTINLGGLTLFLHLSCFDTDKLMIM